MGRRFYIAGFIFGLTAVILGAFAAHGLKPLLTPEARDTFETGVRFQMYHALLLLILGNLKTPPAPLFNWLFYLIILGILLFSGSIYLLATNELTPVDFRIMGPVTPIGGTLLILSWGLLLLHFIKLKKK